MGHELVSRIVGVENGTGNNLQATIEITGTPYPIVCTSSYGPEVKNPSPELIQRYLNGALPKMHPDSPTTLLVPIQANDRCAANCKGCVFARDIVGGGFMASPTTPETMQAILDNARILMHEHGLLSATSTFRVGALLAGDPSFNMHTAELIKLFAENNDITSLRMSTIATDANINPLKAFIEGAEASKVSGSKLKLRFQVSLHSTDASKRLAHVSYHGPINKRLIPLEDINLAFKEIKRITGFRSTLAFVVDSDTDIDSSVLDKLVDRECTDISLRPIISTTKYTANPMLPENFINLFNSLAEEGWQVRVIPSSEKGIEQANTLTKNIPLALSQGVLGL